MPVSMAASPPDLPDIRLSVVDDYTAGSKCDEGYLRVRRRKLVAKYDDGQPSSDPFKYDTVERWNPDAVAILPHFVRDGVRFVILRSSVRVPLALRPEPLIDAARFPPGAAEGQLWEVVAGLVEKDERTPDGLVLCATRETHEEIGMKVEARDVRTLGGPIFPSAGIIGECIYLFECEVDPTTRRTAEGDGPLERGARIVEVPLHDALAWCEAGLLPDAKTELSLRRLSSRLDSGKNRP